MGNNRSQRSSTPQFISPSVQFRLTVSESDTDNFSPFRQPATTPSHNQCNSGWHLNRVISTAFNLPALTSTAPIQQRALGKDFCFSLRSSDSFGSFQQIDRKVEVRSPLQPAGSSDNKSEKFVACAYGWLLLSCSRANWQIWVRCCCRAACAKSQLNLDCD